MIYKSPRCFVPSYKLIGLSAQKKQKIDFQDGHHGSHLGFPIGMILDIFDLQVTQMLPTELQVNWTFSSGEEAKKRFSGWLPFFFSYRNNFSCFYLQVTQMIPTQFQVNWPFGS